MVFVGEKVERFVVLNLDGMMRVRVRIAIVGKLVK